MTEKVRFDGSPAPPRAGYSLGVGRSRAIPWTWDGVDCGTLVPLRGAVLPTEETDRIEVVVLTLEEAMERFRSGEIADAKSILALLYALPA